MTTSRHSRWVPYFFIGPFSIIFLTFVAYPMLHSIALSTQQTYGPQSSRFVGLSNFSYLASDPLFWKAMRNTLVFAAGSLFIQLPCSLALALLLNSPKLRGRTIFRLIFFSPSLIGLTFVAVIFSLIFEKRTGMLNLLLHQAFGFDLEFPWLDEFVMPALIIAAFWMYVGFNMVYFLAALQNVRRDLVEAAIVDGANAWQRFVHVTIPAIRPVATFVALLSMVGSFQLFELPYLLLNMTGGGPDNQGLTLVMYLYQVGFETGDLGYASTVGWVLALILGALAAGQHYMARTGEA
jgi:ABC-type sugar transport system permease subunit